MVRDAGGGWSCSACGHNLQIDRMLQMETAIRLADVPGITFSGAGMSVEAMALYIRHLELDGFAGKRRVRMLERQLRKAGQRPSSEYLREVGT